MKTVKHLLAPLVAFALALLARAVIRRYRPQIVMVTGSVGKTSTKDAVAAALAAKFYLRKSEKSFNSEFGVPFTIFGVGNPWGNPVAWLRVAKSAFALLILPNHYPTMLVLEVGADKPGDLSRILKIATPDAVVVTHLPDVPVHVEAYTSPEQVREEEFSPAFALPPGAPLILASDDAHALALAARLPARLITYGASPDATVPISGIDFFVEAGTVAGMRATVKVQSKEHEVVIRGSVGKTQALPVAAALITAETFGVPLPSALEELAKHKPPPGRGRLLRGLRGSVIIDDSYNASPAAVEEALETLRRFPHAGRRIAVLGDMLELGRYSVSEHARIGALARNSADLVVTVGVRARAFTGSPGPSEAMTFENSRTAGQALADSLRPGDVVLVKGSQSMRMERIVERLLADPADVKLLVRQEKAWRRRE